MLFNNAIKDTFLFLTSGFNINKLLIFNVEYDVTIILLSFNLFKYLLASIGDSNSRRLKTNNTYIMPLNLITMFDKTTG